MPVSKTSSVGSSSSKSGAGRWIGQRSTSTSGSPWSIGVADHVHEAAERLLADRHGDRRARVDDLDAAREAVGGVHGDGADLVVAEVLLHLADDLLELAVPAVDADREGVVDGRDLVREADVDDRPDHLDDCACVHSLNSALRVWSRGAPGPGHPRASAPATTSRISCVMAA